MTSHWNSWQSCTYCQQDSPKGPIPHGFLEHVYTVIKRARKLETCFLRKQNKTNAINGSVVLCCTPALREGIFQWLNMISDWKDITSFSCLFAFPCCSNIAEGEKYPTLLEYTRLLVFKLSERAREFEYCMASSINAQNIYLCSYLHASAWNTAFLQIDLLCYPM